MLEKRYLHQIGVELNFLFIGLASRPCISLRINPRIREDSKGVPVGQENVTTAPKVVSMLEATAPFPGLRSGQSAEKTAENPALFLFESVMNFT